MLVEKTQTVPPVSKKKVEDRQAELGKQSGLLTRNLAETILDTPAIRGMQGVIDAQDALIKKLNDLNKILMGNSSMPAAGTIHGEMDAPVKDSWKRAVRHSGAIADKQVTRTNIKGRVARVLFNAPRGKLTKYGVAKRAESGYPWVKTILQRLEGDGIIRGTQVIDFRGLMKWWRLHQPSPKYRDYLMRRPLKALDTKLDYALTSYYAEDKIQGYLFTSSLELHIRESDKRFWHELVMKKGASAGKGDVRLISGDEHVFYGSFMVDGVRLASIPQIMLDLYDLGGAAHEAADMIMEKWEKEATVTEPRPPHYPQ
ncbi:hypothetical protein CENSYa_0571 [Cenarchaeum symbiosum A]|uniref:Uncharacterized protein n=1 Tax=Cenarchaeum symbiosum (strain A) TaxID=414004 RepID=A0RV37_CENSY|nr:hypothetical protein CENSYa_0571 [Cenarchaeum symbiosum A]